MLRKLRPRSTYDVMAALAPLRLIGLVAACCAALALAAAPASASPKAYVALGGFDPSAAKGIAIFDVATGARVRTIALSTSAFSIAIDPTGTRAYVADGNGVEVVKLKTNTVVKTIPAVGGDVAVDPSGTRVYVTNQNTNKLDVIDTATNVVTKSISVGQQPRAVVANASGTRAYTGNTISPYTISVVDLTTDADKGDVSSANLDRPENLGISPNGAKVYAANFGANSGGTTVGILDAGTNSVGSVPVGKTPSSVMVNPSGTTAYVANRDSSSLSLIATASSTNVGTVPVGFSPTNIAIAPDGRRAFLTGADAVTGDSAYAVFDLVQGKVVVGPAALPGASDVAITPAEQPVPAIKVKTGLSKERTSFDASASTGGPAVRYDWSFGDGKRATRRGPKITHTYSATGTYALKLTETNGCASSAVFGPLGVAFNGSSAFCKGSRTGVKRLTVHIPKAAVGVVLTRKAKVARDGVARVRVACVKELSCTGKISLRSAGKIKTGNGSEKKRVKFGSATLNSLAAGAKRTLEVKLSSAGLAVLRSLGTVEAKAIASVKNPGGKKRSRTTKVKLTFAGP